MTYDDHNNQTGFVRKAKPGSGLSDLTVSAVYDPTWNKPTSITNARGVTTNFTYYASGTTGASEMHTAVRPADGNGHGTATYNFTYTSIGELDTSTDPDGVVTDNTYDGASNLTATAIDPAHINSVTSFTYDSVGNVLSTTDPRGFATTSIYDLDRRKTEYDLHNGNAATVLVAASANIYDALGRVTDTKAGIAFSGTTVTTWLTTAHTTYTPTSKPTGFTDADGRTVTTIYDDLDRSLTITDPVGRGVHNQYDAAGQLIIEYHGWGSLLQQAYATHVYSLNGKETSVSDADGPAHLTTYTYDGFDRVAKTTYADASHEDLAYDPNGNVLTRRNRGNQLLTYDYDLLDRPITKAVPPSAGPAHTITTTYTAAGRTTYLTDSAGPIIAYTLDTAGRATAESQTILGAARSTSWTLDASGNHTTLIWPDAYAVDYTFDALGRMNTVAVHGGSTLATYAYDPLSRRTSVTYGAGAGTSSMAYTWTDAGDLHTLTDHFGGGSTADVTFTDLYTDAHQLQSETISNPAYAWTPPTPTGHDAYGAVNNLNQYPTVKGGAVTWDRNGNLTTIGTGAYAHDAENRLIAVSGTTPAGYTYDPLGRRIAKNVDGHLGPPQWGAPLWGAFTWTANLNTTFLHDGDNEIAEYDNGGALIRRFVPGAAIDEDIAMVTAAGATTFFHTDRKGSVIAMANTSGVRVEGPYTYDAYGNCFVGATTISCTTLAATAEPYRYTGQRYDVETELYYYRDRYYGPGIGRFYETDSAGYESDLNWYSFVGNDPTDKSDPSGDLPGAGSCSTGSRIAGGGDATGCNVDVDSLSSPKPKQIALLAGGARSLDGTNYEQFVRTAVDNIKGAATTAGETAAEDTAVSISAVAGLATLALVASTRSTVNREGDELPQNLIRGGESKQQDLIAKDVVGHAPFTGISATSAPGMSVDQLARTATYRNPSITVTTVQKLQDMGYRVVPTPLPGQPLHVTILTPMPVPPTSAALLSKAFRIQPNPSRGK
jgi:RHS repeat-associated protein